MENKPVKIQVIPPFGGIYQVILPEDIQTTEQIQNWISDNLKYIETWAWSRIDDK